MDCQHINQEDMAERYLNGQLAGPLLDEFEVHLLECPECLDSLESLRELRTAVAGEAPRIRLASERKKSPFWFLPLATASLLVLVAVGFFQKLGISTPKNQVRPPQQAVAPQANEQPLTASPAISAQKEAPTAGRKSGQTANAGQHSNMRPGAATLPSPPKPPEIETRMGQPPATLGETKAAEVQHHDRAGPRVLTPAEAIELYKLAEVHPAQYSFPGPNPGYRTSKQMSAAENTGAYDPASTTFQHAMVAYLEKRYLEASEMLEAATQPQPDAPHINFYLGVCRLLLGRPDDAISPLSKVIIDGKSRYVQSAHVYLAKAYLQKADLKHAEAELESASIMPGQLKTEATSLLDRVRVLRRAVESSNTSPQ